MKIIDFIKKYPRSTAIVGLLFIALFGGFFAWAHADYAKHPAFWIVLAFAGLAVFVAVRQFKASDKGDNQR